MCFKFEPDYKTGLHMLVDNLYLYKYENVCLSVCLFAFFSAIWNPIGIPSGTKLVYGLEKVLKVFFAELLPFFYTSLKTTFKKHESQKRHFQGSMRQLCAKQFPNRIPNCREKREDTHRHTHTDTHFHIYISRDYFFIN